MAVSLTAAQRSAIDAEVERYAPGAPADLRSTAAELVAAHLESIDTAHESIGFGSQSVGSFAPNLVSAVFRQSGATALLASWRRPRARVIEAAS